MSHTDDTTLFFVAIGLTNPLALRTKKTQKKPVLRTTKSPSRSLVHPLRALAVFILQSLLVAMSLFAPKPPSTNNQCDANTNTKTQTHPPLEPLQLGNMVRFLLARFDESQSPQFCQSTVKHNQRLPFVCFFVAHQCSKCSP